MKKNIWKRLFSFALALVLVAGMVPSMTLTANASNISTSASTIQKGHYIYFGSSGQKWRVLDASATSTGGTGMFLWSENSLGTVTTSQNYTHSYDNDGFRTWCTNYYNNNFSSSEQSVMLATTKAAENYSYTNSSNFERTAKGGALNGDHLFLLSVSEVLNTSYFADDNSRDGLYAWYLRSHTTVSSYGDWYTAVGHRGEIGESYASNSYYMHPGFNLDTSKILFVTAATGGKTDGLSAVSTSGSDWKLTLKDSNSFSNGASISKTTVCSGGPVTVTHKALSAISSDYTNVTAAIFSGDTMVYYGSVNTDTSATISTITIPSDLATGNYTLKLYGEDWNGDQHTDIATGTPYSVAITVQTHTGGTATCVSGKICTNCGVEYTDKASSHGTLNYSASGNVITETCSNNCGLEETATLTESNSSYTYTGSPITPLTVSYSDDWQGDKNLTVSYSNNTNAGTATGSITYKGATASQTFTISTVPITDSSIGISFTPDSVTYNGSDHSPSVTVTWNGGTLAEGTHYTLSWDKTGFTNADTYTATITGKENFSGSTTKTFTIKAADLTEVSVAAEELTYTGQAQTPTVTAKATAKGGQTVNFTYSQDGINYRDTPFSYTYSGTYTVYWKATADNHNTEYGSFTVKVNPADGTASVRVAVHQYGDTLIPVPVSKTNGTDGVTYLYRDADKPTNPFGDYTDEVPTLPGNYTVKAIFAATNNYNEVTAYANFSISKRSVEITADSLSKTYGEDDPELTWTVTDGSIVNNDNLDIQLSRTEGDAVGTYTITASAGENASPYYDITFVDGTFTINAIVPTVSVTPAEGLTYNGASQALIASGSTDGGTLYYKLNDGEWTTDIPTATKADDYTVYWKVVGTEIYADVEAKSTTVTIAPASLANGNITLSQQVYTYDGAEHKPTVTVTLDGFGTLTEGVDYTLEYVYAYKYADGYDEGIVGVSTWACYSTDFTNVSAHSVQITGIGNFTDELTPVDHHTTRFAILRATPTAEHFTFTTTDDLTYNGTAKTATIALKSDYTGCGDITVYYKSADGEWTTDAPTQAGTYAVGIELTRGANFTETTGILTDDSWSFTIAKKTITIDVDDQTLTYGDDPADLQLTFVANGFAAADTLESLGAGEPVLTANYEQYETVGTYAITADITNVSADNYTFTTVPGTLTVNKAQVTQDLTEAAGDLLQRGSSTVTLPELPDTCEHGTPVFSAPITTAVLDDGVLTLTGSDDVDLGATYTVTIPVSSPNYESYEIVVTLTGRDTIAPVIAGVEEGKTYYTTQTVTVSDKNLSTITVNGQTATSPITLAGNQTAAYTIVAADLAGNSTTVLVKMAPISDITDAMDGKTTDNVTSADQAALESIVDTVTELLEDAAMTAEEKTALEQAKADAEDLLAAIEEAADAVDTENTAKVEDVTNENVKLEDKEALEDAKADLEQALEENRGNYTADEQQAIEDEIQRMEDALEAIENVESVEDAVSALPAEVEPDDEATVAKIVAAKEAYDALTDYEKSLVDETVKTKLDSLTAAVVAYEIIKGDGGKWTKDSSYSLSFTANGPVSKLSGIAIDGQTIAAKYYTIQSGSTIVTLKASYLQTLSVGKHTITVLYTDGAATGTFTVTANPATGDDSHTALWAAVLGISALGAAALLIELKRRKTAR